MKRFLLLIAALGCFVACTMELEEPNGIVITNARVIDGTGGPSRAVNVRIVEDRITQVGDFDPADSDQIIDADGLVLAPGFVDTHSHHDIGIFEKPDALSTVNQGVTTILVGNDGRHNYPLADFFARIESESVAVNVASYAGHGEIRDRVMGEGYLREATADEVQRMADLLEVEMNAGALGLSSGLEYDPGSFGSTDELIVLSRVAASHGGIYASHIRDEDIGFWEALDEAIQIGQDAELPVRITHIKLAISEWWGMGGELVEKLQATRDSGVDITADIYPSEAWYSTFSWYRTQFPNRDLTDRSGAEYLLNTMLAPDRILIPVYTPNPDYNGMFLSQIAEIRETDPETTLMELLQDDAAAGGTASGSMTIAFAMSEPDVETIMKWPHTVLGSDGDTNGSHPRGWGAFAHYLGHYVRDQGIMSLEEGVRRVSSLPAEQVGLTGRGLIQEGYPADLVLFDPATIRANSSFGEPHLISSGIETVWVNGEVVFKDGATTDNRPGRPIRRANQSE